MAAEIIEIASFTIDFDEVIKESAKLKKEIDKLKKSQKELDVTTTEGAEAFAENDVQIRKLSKAYKDNQQFATALDSANEDLNKTMEVQGKSTQELYDSRSQLQKISKNIVGDTEEEVALRQKLNDTIDQQTEAIRDQSSGFNAGKDSIGEYTDGINKSDLSLQSLISNSKDAGGATNLLTGGLKSVTSGMISFTKASLAFIISPVGLVLAVIAGAFLLVRNAMNRSETATNKIKKALSAFTGIIQGLLKYLEPLGNILIDGLVIGFELLEKAVFKALDAIASGLALLGLDKAAASMRNFNEEIEQAAESGKELAKAEIELANAQRIARKVQLDYQKEAEKLRQIRDDESKSIPERIKANEDLGKVLEKQLQKELEIAKIAKNVADIRVKAEGETTAALDAQAEAITEIADIEERITGQQSEQLVNRIALQKEAAEKVKEIQEAAIKSQKEELALFIEQQGIRAKTLEESVAIEQDISDKRLEILQNELDSKLISQTEYTEQVLAIQNDLLRKQAELTVDNARRALQEYVKSNESKLESDKFLSAQAFEEEKERYNNLAEQRKEFESLKLDEGIISQTDYNEAINAINEENRLLNEELEQERKEAEAERAAEDFENYLTLLDEQNGREFEVLQLKLNNDRAAEVAAAEATGANIDLINKKYAQRQKQLDDSVEDAKLEGFQSVLGSFKEAVGEQSAIGKEVAIADTLITTYQSATSAYSSLSGIPVIGPALGIAAAALAVYSGLSNVSKIKSTPTTYAKGDILKGNSHAAGGIPFSIGGALGFEAEGGEAIINKKSTSMFAPLLSAINVAGGGKRFANGDILGSGSVNVNSSNLIDYDTLASKISESNLNLPSPIVSVEEIQTVAAGVQVVENLSSE